MFNVYKMIPNCCELEDSIEEIVKMRIPNQVIQLPGFVQTWFFLDATDDQIGTNHTLGSCRRRGLSSLE